ncbi:MAG: HEAT repeat domain-containing protein [Kofleriaceae bacterium]
MPGLLLRRRSLGFCLFLVLTWSGCTSAAVKRSVRSYEQGDYQAAAAAADQGIAADAGDTGAWQMRLRAALALGDLAGLRDGYARYRASRGGGDDPELLVELAVATLRQGLESPSVALRIAAIRGVEQHELLALADAVAQRLADRDDRVVATAAAAVLRGYADAATALDDMTRSEEPVARRIAVDGLGRKIAKLAARELVAAAADPDVAVRATALRYLGELGSPEHAALFARHLRETDEVARAACVRALAKVAAKPAAVELARGALATARKDPASSVRLAALALAEALADRAALGSLADDADPVVALQAALALGTAATVGGAILDRGLAAAEWTTRAAMLNQARAAVGPALALEKARARAADPDVRVRLAAGRALGSAGAKAEAIEVAAAALAAPEQAGDSVTDAAVDLALLGDPRGVAALAQQVGAGATADLRARAAAAHVLAHRVTPGLVAALADASGAVRVAAAAALAALTRHTR